MVMKMWTTARKPVRPESMAKKIQGEANKRKRGQVSRCVWGVRRSTLIATTACDRSFISVADRFGLSGGVLGHARNRGTAWTISEEAISTRRIDDGLDVQDRQDDAK
ncbi:uncharacterized protein BP5553_08740 [Venustampulla echinocandica]|uniref:Uncharacterized protein n=1 Tax=Venustampulla echinocandica TaxID=2656787 RepID=A0A370TF47_9HELO|nr:uncharacterized protein BP5553_08740 [Venustampulla echinocandica]RDL33301.1 hypothetical protein BP5553_08740 [Venustampulla echinocandica]